MLDFPSKRPYKGLLNGLMEGQGLNATAYMRVVKLKQYWLFLPYRELAETKLEGKPNTNSSRVDSTTSSASRTTSSRSFISLFCSCRFSSVFLKLF
jgi:hypothetical protein